MSSGLGWRKAIEGAVGICGQNKESVSSFGRKSACAKVVGDTCSVAEVNNSGAVGVASIVVGGGVGRSAVWMAEYIEAVCNGGMSTIIVL